MNTPFDDKQIELKNLFTPLSREEKYQKIIELGKDLTFPPPLQTPENRVHGCQSQMFLISTLENNLIYFQATSDALISKGLAALLLHLYNLQTPETLLKCPPTALQDLGIPSIISPSRANGLTALHTRMQQHALKYLTGQLD